MFLITHIQKNCSLEESFKISNNLKTGGLFLQPILSSMSENDKIPSKLTQEESSSTRQEPENIRDPKDHAPDPYPKQEQREGADNEQYIINNANGNGINPNPLESGNKPEWIDGRKQNDDYIADATD